MSTAAPFDSAPDDPAPPGDDPPETPQYATGVARVPTPDGDPHNPDGTGDSDDPPTYAGRVPLPPPVHLQPRVHASPPAPAHRGEWRVLLFALIVAGLLLLCFCLAGYAFFLNGGFGAGE